MKIGTLNINDAKLGTEQIDKIYLGQTLVWTVVNDGELLNGDYGSYIYYNGLTINKLPQSYTYTVYPTYTAMRSNNVLSKWNGVDISEYNGDKNVFIQGNDDISNYYEISESDHFTLENLREESQYGEDFDLY